MEARNEVRNAWSKAARSLSKAGIADWWSGTRRFQPPLQFVHPEAAKECKLLFQFVRYMGAAGVRQHAAEARGRWLGLALSEDPFPVRRS